MRLLDMINYQRELLSFLGYELDLKENELPLFKNIRILKDGKDIGVFEVKKLNLFYLDKDGYMVGNIAQNTRYSREKEKNMHTMCHIIINDGKIIFNCYNGIKNMHSDLNIIDKYALILNDNYILCNDKRNGKNEISVCYEDDNILYQFIYNSLDYKIHIRTSDNDILIEDISENGELLDKMSVMIKKISKIDLLGNSLKYIKNKEKEKVKTYKPE